ncbi:hypothetical protein VPH35_123964 [Triticum aestivum]
MLTTFNIVGYITERELNNGCGVPSICNPLHIELHLICSFGCCTLPCHAYLNGTWIILVCASCHFVVVIVYYVVCFLSGVLRLGNPVTSCCEDSFDNVRLSSSWTRSSSLRDLRCRCYRAGDETKLKEELDEDLVLCVVSF